MPVFLPVFLFVHNMLKGDLDVIKLSAVLAAPVVGHAFPIFYRMKGGKGIAVSFGCLLGMLPMWKPAAILAAYFIFSHVYYVYHRIFTGRLQRIYVRWVQCCFVWKGRCISALYSLRQLYASVCL